MCDCFHLAFPNWQAASSGTAGRRLRAPEPGTEDDSTCDEPSQFTERPRPQGSSPVEEYPETERYTDSDKECEAEHDRHHKSGSGKKSKKSGLGSMFEKRSTPKMSKLKEDHSPDSGVIVKTAPDGCSEGLVYGGGGREGIFIKEVVPESPASKSLKLKEGDQILSATVYFDNVSYEDAVQILEHAQAYKMKLCLKRNPGVTETESAIESDVIPEEDVYVAEMREQGKTKRRSEARISWPKFPSFGKGRKSRFTRSHSSSEADEQRKLELSPTTSDTESPIKSQDTLKGKKKHKTKLSGLTKRGRISSSENQETDAPTSAQMLSHECLESPSGETPQVYVTEELKVVEDLRRDQELTEPQTVQHKVELITIGSTLKTEDLTLAMADGSPAKKDGGFRLTGFGVNLNDDSPKADISCTDVRGEVKVVEAKEQTFKQPKFGEGTLNINVNVPDANEDINIDGAKIKTIDREEKAGKFHLPNLGISMPKVKGPTIDISLSKQDVDVTLPEAKAEVKLPEAPDSDITLGTIDVPNREQKIEVEKPEFKVKHLKTEGELDGQGGKFKMPKLGMSMPKVEGPEINFGLSKKDGDVTLPEAKAEVKVPVVELKESSAKMEMKAPEIKVEAKGTEGSPSKFKMPTFKLPKFGVGTPNVSVEVPDMDKDVKIEGADINIPDEGSAVDIAAPSIDIEGPSVDMKSTAEQDGKGSKYKMPHLGFSMPKVKGPKMYSSLPKKDIDVKLPETKVDVKIPEINLGKVDVSIPEAKIEVKKPEMEMQFVQTEDEHDRQEEKLKMAKSGIKMPKVKGPEFDMSLSKKHVEVKHLEAPKIDVSLGKEEVLIPEAKMEVENPEMEIKPLQTGSELEGHRGKFQMAKFGITMPKVKGPEIDLSYTKKDVDVTLPGAKAEVELPEAPKIAVDMKPPECEAEIDGQGSKFKMPKFGISMPKVKGPEFDLSSSKKDVDVTLPKAKAEVELPGAPKIAVDMKPPECEAEIDGQGSKFKMPKFGISMSKVKGPEFDLSSSKKDVDISLPETEVNLPNVELKESSAKVEIKAPEIEAQLSSVKGSPSKFKLPTFKFPKFGATTPNVSTDVPDIDKEITIDATDMHISVPHTDVDQPEVKAEVHLPVVHVKKPSGGVVIEQQPGVEVDGKLKKTRFSLPRFSFSKQSVKAPEVDASLQDVNAAIPEGKVEVELPEYEAEVEGSKFKMPKFGISMPQVTGDVTLPETKAEMKLPNVEVKEPEVEIIAPEIKIATKDTEDHSVSFVAKYKMPTFKLPKFGVGTPSATIEVPDKDVKIDGADIEIPEEVLSVHIAAPSIDIKDPSFEHEGKGSKFKLPSLGFSGPQMKRPDIDLSLSKKDVDVTLPEAKADVELPDVELKETSAKVEIKAPEIKITTKDKEGSPSKFKMPTFKLPKFGVGSPSATIEVPDKDVKIDGADIDIPEEVLAVDIAAPSIDIKSPSIDIKTTGTEHEGKGSKFKLPSLSFSGPQMKRPDIDLSLSKKDVDVTLPEARAEVKLPDVKLKESSAEVEIKAPEIKIATKDTEDHSVSFVAKYKMPTFKLPKFGVGTQSATIEVPDKDVKIDGADIEIPEKVLSVHIAAPSIDIKDPSFEHEGKGSKFKLPSLGFSGPQMKRPDIDLSLSKKDVDVTLPEARAEVKLPDVKLKESYAEVEIKAPEINITTKDKKGSPSKFKMPTFKLPKFGVGSPSATIEVPAKDVKIDGADIDIPEEVLAVDIAAPSIDIKSPSIDIKTTGTEHEGKGSKFKLPSLSFSGPQMKRPDIDLSLSKKDVDVTLPEAKADVKLPDIKLKESSAEVEIKAPEIKIATRGTEGSPSKYKMPTFKLPKFGVGTPSATIQVPDKDVKIDGADIDIPEEVLAVNIAAPSIDIKSPSIDIKTTGTEHEGKGSKFKLPSLGFSGPQMKRPDIDLSLSKKDVDVTLPEAKDDVKLPDVELKETSAKVEIKAPEIKITTKDKEGSPSKFKMPTFKLPKFGVGSPSATIEVPDKDVKIDGADIDIPEEVLAVDIAAPSIDIKSPSIDIKSTGTEHEGKGSKFKLPSLSFSGPQMKRPDIDLSLSKKDVDVTLPEAKAEVKLPDVKLKESSAEVEIKAPEIKIATKVTEGSPSKYKMPTFKLPKFGVGTPSATIEVPDKDVKIDGADIDIPEEVLAVDIAAPRIDIKSPSIDIKTTGTEHEGKGSKFKLPSLGFSGPQIKRPDIDLSLSKKDVDVTLPEAKAEVKLPDVKLKESSAEVEIKAPEIKIATKVTEGSPSKYKMPTFKLPKFGVGTPSATIEVPDTEGDVKIDGPDIQFPEEVLSVDIAAPNIDIKDPSFEHEGKGSKFKLPSLSFSGPQMKRPDIDLSLSKKDVDVTLPEAKADVKLPDIELKETSAKVEIKAPEIKITTKDKEGSPSKFKMPTFKLPKFGVGSPSATIEVPDKDVKIDGADIDIPEEVLAVDIAAPSIDIKSPSIDIKTTGTEHEGKGSKFKLPSLSFSGPQMKRPDIDLSLSKKDVDVTLPEARAEVKLPDVKLNESSAEVEIKAPEIKIATKGTEGSPSKYKMPTFKLPKFGVGTPSATIQVPDKDVKIDGADIDIPEEVLAVDIAAPSIDIKSPSIDIKTTGTEHEGKGSKFKLPSLGFSGPQMKRPDIDLSLSKKDVDVTLPEAKDDVKLPDVELKETSAKVEIKAPEIKITTKDKEGSPSKFKMPTFKLPKFGVGTPSATIEVPDTEGDVKIDGPDIQFPEEVLSVDIAAPNIDIKDPSFEHEGKGSKFKLPSLSFSGPQMKRPDIDLSLSKKDVDVTLPEAKADVKLPDIELKETSAKVEIKAPEIKITTKDKEGSPSKFKMPTFKLPKFGVGSPSATIEVPDKDVKIDGADIDIPEEVLAVDIAAPSIDIKSPSIDIKTTGTEHEGKGKNLETSKEVHETDEAIGEQLQAREKETKQDATKSPERTGWFKFPKFGLSSPSEPAKVPERDERKDEKSPAGETVDEEISPTCSVQSSDAFADISSAMTSEYGGFSLSSPTRVTVKYSDPTAAAGFGELHSNIITSTTKTELISVEPNLPEKITILSSGVSSSSEDTLRLESGKIHLITSNIQATPEAQHAKLLAAVQIQSAAGFPQGSEANEAASWTVEDSQSGKTTVFEKHFVRETSSERSESKETIVITKQITRRFDSSEPISGETASSIQRLKDSMHSDKMRFFDGADE
ncbi:hypothetical protein VZT92_009248 [Zoarces viviparus]|uniref:PDZ domain-containing protein n=1 Tax=Zoarces viviparus TaxID=48416 RepID=A0AAW1FHA1_ZOAVI